VCKIRNKHKQPINILFAAAKFLSLSFFHKQKKKKKKKKPKKFDIEENYSNFSLHQRKTEEKEGSFHEKIPRGKVFFCFKLSSIHLFRFSHETSLSHSLLRWEIKALRKFSHSSFAHIVEDSLSCHENPINQSDFVYIITLFVLPFPPFKSIRAAML
jgi:hypothetical protein